MFEWEWVQSSFTLKTHEQITWSDYLSFGELMWVNTCSCSSNVILKYSYMAIAKVANTQTHSQAKCDNDDVLFHIRYNSSNMKLSKKLR